MVTAEPELCDVLIVNIFSDLLRFDVTMVVDYREIFCVFVIKCEGGIVFQKEVVAC